MEEIKDLLNRAELNEKIADLDATTDQYWARKSYDRLEKAIDEAREYTDSDEVYEEFVDLARNQEYEEAMDLLE